MHRCFLCPLVCPSLRVAPGLQNPSHSSVRIFEAAYQTSDKGLPRVVVWRLRGAVGAATVLSATRVECPLLRHKKRCAILPNALDVGWGIWCKARATPDMFLALRPASLSWRDYT